MAHWNEGYVIETDYTYGYYNEINPHQATIPFLMANVALPTFKKACELGFGQGISVNMHAAASTTAWHANDFNPNQVSFAQNLAGASDANVTLSDDAFAQFCVQDSLPDFDFIALHGIWTWISDSNRKVIVDFISRKLKVGGVLYISYNTLPGWSAHAPIRHMLVEYDKLMGSPGKPMNRRIGESVDFAKELFSLTTALNQQAPQIQERVNKISEQNVNYLAHEYFNKDWQPMYFSDIATWLADAKMSYVCSPSFNEDYKVINYAQEQLDLLNQINNTTLSETVQDFLLNRQFRKDYWIKGAKQLTSEEKHQKWQTLSFLLVTQHDKVTLTAARAELREEIYKPLLDFLSDHRVHAFEELEKVAVKNNIQLYSLYESLAILHSKDDIKLILKSNVSETIKQQCQKLNTHIMNLNVGGKVLPFLASPLTGGAIHVDHIDQLLLVSYTQKNTNPKDWAAYAWGVLQKQNRFLIVENKRLETPEENIARLEELAHELKQHNLNIYKTLGLVE